MGIVGLVGKQVYIVGGKNILYYRYICMRGE
jgi:hypothetical protein